MRTHAPAWGVLVAAFSLVLIVGFGAFGVGHVVDAWVGELPSVHDPNAFTYSAKTRIYANDRTTLLAEFYLQDQEPIEKDQVGDYVLEGTVATEDTRFYEHEGVDYYGIGRALVNNLKGGSLEGASTITQQLVRNTLLSNEANDISFRRKVREAELAIEMEQAYSKDDILLGVLWHRGRSAALLLQERDRPYACRGGDTCGHPSVADVQQPRGLSRKLHEASQRRARPHAHARNDHAGGTR